MHLSLLPFNFKKMNGSATKMAMWCFCSQFILLNTCVTLCILQRTKISVMFLWSY